MASNPFNLAAGSTVWVFGRGDAPEVSRITSETSRSWVVGRDTKIPKSNTAAVYDIQPGFGCTLRHCLTREAADAMFLERSRWTMSQRVRECTDPAVLRLVAASLGMPTGVDAKEGT